MKWPAFILALLATPVIASGPISKFDSMAPSADLISQVPIHDAERCLIDLEGHPAPQVYAQPDRPGEILLLWQVGWKTVARADLRVVPEGLHVRMWRSGSQMLSCVKTGTRSDPDGG